MGYTRKEEERKRPRRRPGRAEDLGSQEELLPQGYHPKEAQIPAARGVGGENPYTFPEPDRRPSELKTAASFDRGGDEEPRITAARERLTVLLSWLVEHDTADPLFRMVEAAYHAQATAIDIMRRGPLEYLSRPGDEWVGPPALFPGDDPDLPFPAGKWERLPDGRILATGLTLFDLRVMKELRQIAREARINE